MPQRKYFRYGSRCFQTRYLLLVLFCSFIMNVSRPKHIFSCIINILFNDSTNEPYLLR